MNTIRDLELRLADELGHHVPNRRRVRDLCAQYVAAFDDTLAVTRDSMLPISVEVEDESASGEVVP